MTEKIAMEPAVLPEVVPIESLSVNTIRNDEAWAYMYRYGLRSPCTYSQHGFSGSQHVFGGIHHSNLSRKEKAEVDDERHVMGDQQAQSVDSDFELCDDCRRTAALNPLDPEVSTWTPRNIAVLVMYRVDDCLAACANLNDLARDKNLFRPMCQSITFVLSMKSALSQFPGNSFLRNSTLFDLKQAGISVDAVSAEASGLRG